MQNCNRLLDYVACHSNATLRYHTIQMILHVDTDASYLVLPKAISRMAAYYYLSNQFPLNVTKDYQFNAAILVD